MPRQLVAYNLEEGGQIVVEVDLPQAGIQRVAREDEIVKASQTFDATIAQVRPAAEKIIAVLRGIVDPPDEMAVEFGIKLGAKTGVVVASADLEANYKVTLSWKGRERGAPSDQKR
jgi:hypothetical protein